MSPSENSTFGFDNNSISIILRRNNRLIDQGQSVLNRNQMLELEDVFIPSRFDFARYIES